MIETQRERDDEHLKLLGIFHYVAAGLVALGGFIPLIYLGVGVALLARGIGGSGTEGPPRQVGWLFIGLGAAVATLLWGLAVCLVLAGRAIQHRRWYTFCVVVAVLALFSVPFGTVLGVFTLVVLTRDSVKEQFRLPPPSLPSGT